MFTGAWSFVPKPLRMSNPCEPNTPFCFFEMAILHFYLDILGVLKGQTWSACVLIYIHVPHVNVDFDRIPSGQTTSKWRRIAVDATSSRRIDDNMTSLRCHVPVGFSPSYFSYVLIKSFWLLPIIPASKTGIDKAFSSNINVIFCFLMILLCSVRAQWSWRSFYFTKQVALFGIF